MFSPDNISSLQILANVAAITTLAFAIIGYVVYRAGRYRKRKQLEKYVRDNVESDVESRLPSPLDASAALGITESDVLAAAFKSKRIKTGTTTAMFGAPSRVTLAPKD